MERDRSKTISIFLKTVFSTVLLQHGGTLAYVKSEGRVRKARP
jgi:hypothetical protein